MKRCEKNDNACPRKKRVRIDINGRVQGVGFRPTVYRYARDRNLAGWVSNTSSGVIIEAEGDSRRVDDFLKSVQSSPPPQSEITAFSVSLLPLRNDKQFEILRSIAQPQINPAKRDAGALARSEAERTSGGVKTQISPDIATCDECFGELFDPGNRRHLYPFLNCTNCGPRFTIVNNIPYDRDRTTMKEFVMCPECHGEYKDPLNRRFHAQPNACGKCGPEAYLIKNSKLKNENGDALKKGKEAVEKTAKLLKQGKIVAIKGLGGFHLACDATNDTAVSSLRERKYREDKPLALMAKDLETIKQYCEVTPAEEKLLTSWRRPIVLLRRIQNAKREEISEKVAPGNKYLGFMLPYTPLHHLLFNSRLSVLVMTSGNLSDEPIAYENDEALSRLSHIADYFLLHNRDIYIRCDDSVTRIFNDRETVIRRSRGYVPEPIRNQKSEIRKPILACGPYLKNTFALAKGKDVFVSHHIGDLGNLETLQSLEKGIEHFQRLFDIQPEIIAYDLHPEYLSTKYARELSAGNPRLKTVSVQHHHAHIASCLTDNGIDNHKVIGVALDGTGYGTDGTIWGGEFLIADYADFERAGHFKCVPLPGGDAAIREPWRIAAVYLRETYGERFLELDLAFVQRLDKQRWYILEKMIKKRINTPMTSSMGRLFDAVSALIGIRDVVNYEGQAAIELERAITESPQATVSSRGRWAFGLHSPQYGYEIIKEKGKFIIATDGIVKGVVEDLSRSVSAGVISYKFHNTIVEIITAACKIIAKDTGLREVALSGGVFQNMFLLKGAFTRLKQEGFEVYTHSRVPANDGGISLGQVAVANAKL